MVKILFVYVLAAIGVLLTSCNDHESPTQSRASATWTMTSTLSSAEGTDACIPAPAGGPVSFPQFVDINGSSIRISNVVCDDCFVLNGTITGDAFTASADTSFDSTDCGGHVQESDVLTGTFSGDRRQLTATQVFTSVEPSGHQAVIRYAWIGTSH